MTLGAGAAPTAACSSAARCWSARARCTPQQTRIKFPLVSIPVYDFDHVGMLIYVHLCLYTIFMRMNTVYNEGCMFLCCPMLVCSGKVQAPIVVCLSTLVDI